MPSYSLFFIFFIFYVNAVLTGLYRSIIVWLNVFFQPRKYSSNVSGDVSLSLTKGDELKDLNSGACDYVTSEFDNGKYKISKKSPSAGADLAGHSLCCRGKSVSFLNLLVKGWMWMDIVPLCRCFSCFCCRITLCRPPPIPKQTKKYIFSPASTSVSNVCGAA